jgi:hypothetical protein
MRIIGTAVCAAVVAAAAAASASRASAPPAKPLLVNLTTGHVGSAGAGEPAFAITRVWGVADLTANGTSGNSSSMIWLAGGTAWAVATFDDPAQEHASGLFYRGPFRTARNDRNGTSLTLVLKHWPHHGRLRASATLPGYVAVTIGRTRLLFNRSRRLAAVATGTEAATAFANQ